MTDVLSVFQGFVFIVSKRFRFEFYFPLFRYFPRFCSSRRTHPPNNLLANFLIHSHATQFSPHSPLQPPTLPYPYPDEPPARFIEFKVLILEDHTCMFSGASECVVLCSRVDVQLPASEGNYQFALDFRRLSLNARRAPFFTAKYFLVCLDSVQPYLTLRDPS